MRLAFRTNLDEFNEALQAYAKHSRLSVAEVVARKGSDLGFRLYKKLRELTPGKGVVRAERLAAIEAGEGINIRKKIRERTMFKYGVSSVIGTGALRMGKRRSASRVIKGKRLNLQALMVRAELNTRESGRGYLGHSSKFKSFASEIKANSNDIDKQRMIRDRYLRFISSVGFKANRDEAALTMRWGGNNDASNSLAVALQKPKARSKIADALSEARADMMVYLTRKMAEKAAR